MRTTAQKYYIPAHRRRLMGDSESEATSETNNGATEAKAEAAEQEEQP